MVYSDNKFLDTGLPRLKTVVIPKPTLIGAVQLAELYKNLCSADGSLPRRSEITMSELAKFGLLPNVYILEPVENRDDWRYRLIGTEIVARFKIDRTGQTLREFVEPNAADALVKTSNQVALSKQPGYFELVPLNPEPVPYKIETMSLPILSNDGQHTLLFGGTFFSF